MIRTDTVVMAPGARGVDYAHGTPDRHQMANAGISFVFRYIATGSKPVAQSKELDPLERDWLHAGQIAIGLVFENGAGDDIEGATGGRRNGATARQDAAALGYPETCPIVFAIDRDITTSTLNTALSYWHAAADQVTTPGIYADATMLNHPSIRGRSRCSIIANASAWRAGVIPDAFHVDQGSQRHLYGISVDPLTVRKPITLWLPHTEPDPAPPPVLLPPAPAAAATFGAGEPQEGDDVYHYIALTADGRTPVGNERFITNWLVRTRPTFEYAQMLDRRCKMANTLADPVLVTAAELAGIPLVSSS